MSDTHLTVAMGDYDHTRDVANGSIAVAGLKLTAVHPPLGEMLSRFPGQSEWDVAEMSLGKYVAMRAANDNSVTGIPVFPARGFRHAMIYTRDDGKIRRMEDIAGKRFGIGDVTQTGVVYVRGLLVHEGNVPLSSVTWVVQQPPAALADLLLKGEIDAMMSTPIPARYGKGIVRLFEDFERHEQDYVRRTGIYPIMHVVAFRTEVLKREPMLGRTLYQAFEEAKRRSVARLTDITSSHAALPWLNCYSERMKELFGGEIWPYGLDANRPALQAFLQYAYEQDVTARQVSVDELFPN
jgi:4,5-dihydroxyphthalate decarboxylase